MAVGKLDLGEEKILKKNIRLAYEFEAHSKKVELQRHGSTDRRARKSAGRLIDDGSTVQDLGAIGKAVVGRMCRIPFLTALAFRPTPLNSKGASAF